MSRGAIVMVLLSVSVLCGITAYAAGSSAGGAVVTGGQVVPLYGDSGCISVQCSRSCIYNNYTWLCATTAVFERYDHQMRGLPLRVTAIADCVVYTLGTPTCYKSKSATGSGQVTAYATCYVPTIFAGVGLNGGECLCEEL